MNVVEYSPELLGGLECAEVFEIVVPVGACWGEAGVVVPESPFVVEGGWCRAHDVVLMCMLSCQGYLQMRLVSMLSVVKLVVSFLLCCPRVTVL